MTTKTKKPTTKAPTKAAPAVHTPAPLGGSIMYLGLTDAALRAVGVMASSVLYSQPQFSNQATPDNIVGLSDMLFKYMQGQLRVTQPSEMAAQQAAAPTFA